MTLVSATYHCGGVVDENQYCIYITPTKGAFRNIELSFLIEADAFEKMHPALLAAKTEISLSSNGKPWDYAMLLELTNLHVGEDSYQLRNMRLANGS